MDTISNSHPSKQRKTIEEHRQQLVNLEFSLYSKYTKILEEKKNVKTVK